MIRFQTYINLTQHIGISESVKVGDKWLSVQGERKVEKIAGGKAYISTDGRTGILEIIPESELDSEREFQEKQMKSRQDSAEKKSATMAASKAKIDKTREHLDRYLATIKSSMLRGRMNKALERYMTINKENGQPTYKHIERLVSNGAKVKGDRLISPDGTFVDAKGMTAVAIAYGRWLVDSHIKPKGGSSN